MRSWLTWLFVLTAQLVASVAFGEKCVPDELLVKFRPGTPAVVQAAVHRSMRAQVRGRIEALGVELVSLPQGSNLRTAVIRYSVNPSVVYAETNLLYSTHSVPNDPSFAQEWGMDKIQAPAAWNVTQGRPDVTIAILDSGIAADQEDLQGKVVASVNFSSSPTEDDLFGHGTHLAGIAAAIGDNGIGIAGVAYGCSLMNVKVGRDSDGLGSAKALADGIIWAANNGARVISMSVGAPTPNQTVEDAVNLAWGQGAVLVAAAGKAGTSAPVYPAFYSNCMAVAATDQGDQRLSTSGFGNWVDVAAPGVNIFSTLPNVPTGWGQGYGSISGTSQATAFVAGLAGLVWSSPFGGSNAAVRARIEATCDRIPGTGTLWVNGRINAARAVGAIQ
jgi:thermitase